MPMSHLMQPLLTEALETSLHARAVVQNHLLNLYKILQVSRYWQLYHTLLQILSENLPKQEKLKNAESLYNLYVLPYLQRF